MKQTDIYKMVGDIPKPSNETNAEKIMESAEKVTLLIRTKQTIVLLGIQKISTVWKDTKPINFFHGFVKIEREIRACMGYEHEGKKTLTII